MPHPVEILEILEEPGMREDHGLVGGLSDPLLPFMSFTPKSSDWALFDLGPILPTFRGSIKVMHAPLWLVTALGQVSEKLKVSEIYFKNLKVSMRVHK